MERSDEKDNRYNCYDTVFVEDFPISFIPLSRVCTLLVRTLPRLPLAAHPRVCDYDQYFAEPPVIIPCSVETASESYVRVCVTFFLLIP